MICEHCDKAIAEEEALDAHRDDSGDYHYDCYEKICREEASYWASLYYSERRTPEVSGGYEWGDPKNPEYVEHVLDKADTI
jgi:hypothetical protein